MLRKDTIYMLSQDTDSKVPKTAVIKMQAEKFRGRTSGSVRLATGRVWGSDALEILRNRSRKKSRSGSDLL